MRALVFITLLIFTLPVVAHQPAESNVNPAEANNRICAPFRGGVVDPAIVKSMLQASEEGRP